MTVEEVREAFMENYGSDVRLDDVFGEGSEYDVGRQLAKEFVNRYCYRCFTKCYLTVA